MTPQETADFLRSQMRAVYGYCLRRCASPQDAEDVAQDILARTCAALSGSNAVADPLRYLWTAARHTLINHYRDRSRCTVGVPTSVVDDADLPSDLMSREEIRRLHTELARLSRQQRAVVVLHYFHGMKQADIAQRMGIPAGTVKWHLHEAKKELKHHMEAHRPMSYLKFDPIHFSAFGTDGSIGQDGNPWRIFRSTLNQNIAYACWREARSISGIADALGVSPVYIDDAVEEMTRLGYLTAQGLKYRCEILLTEWNAEILHLWNQLHQSAARLVAPKLIQALRAALKDDDIILPAGCSDDYAIWALLPWAIASLPRTGPAFSEAASLRADGGRNLCHATILPPGLDQPALYSLMEDHFSGPCWNGYSSTILWQLDTCWSDKRIGENYHHESCRVLSLLRRMMDDSALSADEYAELAQKGLIRCSGEPDQMFRAELLPVWLKGNPIRDRVLTAAQDVFDEHAATLEALQAPLSAALMADTPPHLRVQREYQIAGFLRSDWFMMHCLYYLVQEGMLAAPTKDEKRSLHTVLLTS